MVEAIVVSTTAGSQEDAETIAAALLDARLAACVQLSSIASRYIWKGQVTREDEVLLTIKTRPSLYAQVEAAIRKVHPYEIPEILATPVVDASADYLAWLAASTGDG